MGSYVVKNTFLDRTKVWLHRKASKLQQEPTVAGHKLKLGKQITITEQQYQASKGFLAQLEGWGVAEVARIGGPEKDAPTPKPAPVPEVVASPEPTPEVEATPVEDKETEESPKKKRRKKKTRKAE